MSEVNNNKKLSRELVEAMNRTDTQWFLDIYADCPAASPRIRFH
jgi:hypothetical protein